MKSGRRPTKRASGKNERPSREAAENAVRTLIQWAGDNPEREGLRGTPARVPRYVSTSIFTAYNIYFIRPRAAVTWVR